MKNGQFVSIKVQKGGIITLPETDREHAVDAISGGSITSKGYMMSFLKFPMLFLLVLFFKIRQVAT